MNRCTDGTSIGPVEAKDGSTGAARARLVVGADGARSQVAKQEVPGGDKVRCVFAYHEIVRSPPNGGSADFDAKRCDVYYQGKLSPSFYAWVFPHGDTTSIGTGSMQKGLSFRGSVAESRRDRGLPGPENRRSKGFRLSL